jgi:hypothetical protein
VPPTSTATIGLNLVASSPTTNTLRQQQPYNKPCCVQPLSHTVPH